MKEATKGKSFHIQGDDISDGYHTFNELYAHRCALFVALCMMNPDACAWKEDAATPGWFILYWESPAGQISYHLQTIKYLPIISKVVQHDPEHQWDGHTSQQVLVRLNACAESTLGTGR